MQKKYYPKKYCRFCRAQTKLVDWKDLQTLRKFTRFFSRIQPRRLTGNCVLHQKMIMKAIKTARFMGLLPFLEK
ncbi:MAG: 30S ribosomal protein S18 [Patescibacteria group bacterium]|nr:30S ribosomal protein S18 [Patescibacteria group bacterium]